MAPIPCACRRLAILATIASLGGCTPPFFAAHAACGEDANCPGAELCCDGECRADCPDRPLEILEIRAPLTVARGEEIAIDVRLRNPGREAVQVRAATLT